MALPVHACHIGQVYESKHFVGELVTTEYSASSLNLRSLARDASLQYTFVRSNGVPAALQVEMTVAAVKAHKVIK